MPLKDIAAILGNSVDILEKDYIILDDRDIERKYKCMLHKLKDVPQRGGHLFFCTIIIRCNKRKEDSL
jgi:hypothetical protein